MVEGLQIAIVPRVNAIPAALCEPVVPFLQVMAPALALSGSFQVLVGAVILKSALFAFFERRLPHLRAAWRIFLGNVLTSLTGILAAHQLILYWIVKVAAISWLSSQASC